MHKTHSTKHRAAFVPKLTRFSEAVAMGDARIDRDAGVIYGVKVCGAVSKNGYRYTAESLKRAVSLYEGTKVNIDHPTKPGEQRSVRDGWGWLKQVRYEKDGIYADLHYNPKHPDTEWLLEAIERNPTQLGLSHVADAAFGKDRDGPVITEIKKVLSVDLVRDPATVSGLFEGTQMANMPNQLPAEEQDDVAVAPVASADPSEAFKQMVVGVLDDSSLDTKAKLAKIKDILTAKEKLMSAPEPEAAPAEDEKPAESAKRAGNVMEQQLAELKASVDQLKAERRAVELLAKHQIAPTPDLISAIARVNESQAELLLGLRAKAPATTPSVKPKSTTVAEAAKTIPADRKQLAEWLTAAN